MNLFIKKGFNLLKDLNQIIRLNKGFSLLRDLNQIIKT
jgi:hypothetical protein